MTFISFNIDDMSALITNIRDLADAIDMTPVDYDIFFIYHQSPYAYFSILFYKVPDRDRKSVV